MQPIFPLVLMSVLLSAGAHGREVGPMGEKAEGAGLNTLTAEEKWAGYELLFNGRDFQGWSLEANWKVEDGTLLFAKHGPSLRYSAKRMPDDFELRFDWKVAPGSNSGICYRPGQYEYQILDNKAYGGSNPRTRAGSLYFCMPTSRDATRPVGDWNTGRIVCQGTVIQHWLNGEKIIDFDYADPQYATAVGLLRAAYKTELSGRGSYLSLQAHVNVGWFRNIKLRVIPPGEVLDRTPITPEVVPKAALEREQQIIEQKQKKEAAEQAQTGQRRNGNLR
jgi:hypothetical protein